MGCRCSSSRRDRSLPLTTATVGTLPTTARRARYVLRCPYRRCDQDAAVQYFGRYAIKKILEPTERKACSFERIYFSRGSDQEIYRERKKLGSMLFPKILEAVEQLTNQCIQLLHDITVCTNFGSSGKVE